MGVNDMSVPSEPHPSTPTAPSPGSPWQSPDLDPQWEWANERTLALPALDRTTPPPFTRR
jgi:hypothetical protein